MTFLIFILMILFISKHFICDFILQGPYQYLNKGIYLHPGGILHSGIHCITTGVILLLFYKWTFFLICFIMLLEFLIHYHMDYLKIKINKKYNLKPDNSEYYWWLLGVDQLIHSLSYILIIYLLIFL